MKPVKGATSEPYGLLRVQRCVVQVAPAFSLTTARADSWTELTIELDRLAEQISTEMERVTAPSPELDPELGGLEERLASFVQGEMDWLDGVALSPPSLDELSEDDALVAAKLRRLLRASRTMGDEHPLSDPTDRPTWTNSRGSDTTPHLGFGQPGTIRREIRIYDEGEPALLLPALWTRQVPRRRVEKRVAKIANWLVTRVPGAGRFGGTLFSALALGLTVLAATLVALGHLRWAALTLALAVPWEILDAELAIKSTDPRRRVFLDEVADRIGDIAILLGISWAYRETDPGIAFLAGAALAVALVSSYVRAEAGALRFDAPALPGRAERIAIVIAALATGWLLQLLGVLLLLGIGTTVQRSIHVWRQDRATDPTTLSGLEWAHKRTVVQLVNVPDPGSSVDDPSRP